MLWLTVLASSSDHIIAVSCLHTAAVLVAQASRKRLAEVRKEIKLAQARLRGVGGNRGQPTRATSRPAIEASARVAPVPSAAAAAGATDTDVAAAFAPPMMASPSGRRQASWTTTSSVSLSPMVTTSASNEAGTVMLQKEIATLQLGESIDAMLVCVPVVTHCVHLFDGAVPTRNCVL